MEQPADQNPLEAALNRELTPMAPPRRHTPQMLEILQGPGRPKMLSGDDVRYNAARDYAYNYKDVFKGAAKLLENGRWPEYKQTFEKELGVTKEDIAQGLECLAAFLYTASVDFQKPIWQVGMESGWDRLPPAVRMAVQAAFGQVMLPMVFTSIREMTPGGPETAPIPLHQLSQAAYSYGYYLAQPRWRRWLLTRCPLLSVRAWANRRFALEKSKLAWAQDPTPQPAAPAVGPTS